MHTLKETIYQVRVWKSYTKSEHLDFKQVPSISLVNLGFTYRGKLYNSCVFQEQSLGVYHHHCSLFPLKGVAAQAFCIFKERNHFSPLYIFHLSFSLLLKSRLSGSCHCRQSQEQAQCVQQRVDAMAKIQLG